MDSQEPYKPARVTQEQFDAVFNRIALSLAKHEAIVESWIAASPRANEPRKTDAELDAEDAILFRPQPPYLGVGAPIPAEYLTSDVETNNKALRAKLFPTKGLKASKARDAEEKAASAKRGLKHDSSDEEEGRSALGRAKKPKRTASRLIPVKDVSDVAVKEEVLLPVGAQREERPSPTSIPEVPSGDALNNESSSIVVLRDSSKPSVAANEGEQEIDADATIMKAKERKRAKKSKAKAEKRKRLNDLKTTVME